MPQLSKSFAILMALCASLAISLVASAQSQSGKVTGNYTVTHSGMVFDARGASGEYALSKVSTRTVGAAKGRYLVAINKPLDITTANVLGREKKGSLILALARSNGGADLNVSLKVNDSLNKRPIQGATEYTLPLTFTKGTWADYVAGKDVTLALGAGAAALYTSSMGQLMAKVFTEGLAGGLDGITVTTTIDGVTLLESPTIQANLRQIRVPSLVTNYIITLKSYSKATPSTRR